MKIETFPTRIEGCKLVKTKMYLDDRGTFEESFQMKDFAEAGLPHIWMQDNVSISFKRTLRGLHTQTVDPQGKLVRCFGGSIFDVCVDLRPSSPSFRQWFGVHLSWERPLGLYVPPGCAHGFLVTAESAMVHYKCTTLYAEEHQSGVHWQDPSLGIEWPLKAGDGVLVSNRDAQLPSVDDYFIRHL